MAAVGLGERGRREDMRDVVRGERDHRYRALGVHLAEPLDDPRRGQAEAALAQHFERDEIALLGAAGHADGNEHLAPEARFSIGSTRPAPVSSSR